MAQAPTLQIAAVETAPEACPTCKQLVRIEAPVDPQEPRRWVCTVGHGGTIGIPDVSVRRRQYPTGSCQRCGSATAKRRFCVSCRREARAALDER